MTSIHLSMLEGVPGSAETGNLAEDRPQVVGILARCAPEGRPVQLTPRRLHPPVRLTPNRSGHRCEVPTQNPNRTPVRLTPNWSGCWRWVRQKPDQDHQPRGGSTLRYDSPRTGRDTGDESTQNPTSWVRSRRARLGCVAGGAGEPGSDRLSCGPGSDQPGCGRGRRTQCSALGTGRLCEQLAFAVCLRLQLKTPLAGFGCKSQPAVTVREPNGSTSFRADLVELQGRRSKSGWEQGA
jgi:hypothetical protein